MIRAAAKRSTCCFSIVTAIRDQVNHDQLLHHGDPISLSYYVTSALFWADVMENWQSEDLQFSLYIFATVFLLSMAVEWTCCRQARCDQLKFSG